MGSKRAMGLAAGALASALGLSACGSAASSAPPSHPATAAPAKTSAAALQNVTLDLGWTAQGWMAAFGYGATHGIFKRYGINLKLVPGTGSETTVESVAKGEFPFGLADGTTLAVLYSKGVRTVMVGGYLQQSATDIVVAKRTGITTPQQLAGKVLAETPTTDTFEMMPAFLKAVGLPPGSIHYLALSGPARIPAIISGHAVGEVGLGTIEDGPVIASKGVPVRYFPFAKYGVKMDESEGIIVRPQLIQSDPGLIRRFIEATRASVLGAEQHPHAAVQAMAQLFPSAHPAVAVMLQQWKGAEALLTTPSDKGHPLGWMAPNDWKAALQLAVTYMHIATPPQVAQLYTNQFEK